MLRPALARPTLKCPECQIAMKFSWGLDLYYCETHGRQITAQAQDEATRTPREGGQDAGE